MTDEQVDRLVRALTESNSGIEAAVIAVASVVVGSILGFLLTLLLQRMEAKRSEATQSDKARRDAANRAGEAALQYVLATDQEAREAFTALNRATPELMNALNDVDPSGNVSGWWVRQTIKIRLMPFPRDQNDSAAISARSRIGGSVTHRLRGWASGEYDSSEFAAAHDSEWENTVSRAAGSSGV